MFERVIVLLLIMCSMYIIMGFESTEEDRRRAEILRRALFPSLTESISAESNLLPESDRIVSRRRRTQESNITVISADDPQEFNVTDEEVELNIVDEDGEVESVQCIKCLNLEYCEILNGFMVQETYFPENSGYQGTCGVIENVAARLNGEIFGVGRTFRDTPQCRSIVMQYLCLFWGSNNDMYVNKCDILDSVNRPLKKEHLHTQTPPCRSFCVQIAEVCANDYTAFLNVCLEIECPPEATFCTPDPKIEDLVVATNIGCNMPFDADPYASNSAPSFATLRNHLVLLCVSVVAVLLPVLF